MRVLLFADAPAGDGFADRLRKLGADVEYVRNPHPKRIIVGKGFAYVIAMNARGMGVQIREACRTTGAKFLSVPPGWAAAQPALEEAGLLRDLAPKPAPATTPAPAPHQKPRATTWMQPGAKPEKAPSPPPPPPPAEPVKESPPMTLAKPGPSKEAQAKAMRVRQFLFQTKFDWAVVYLRHNPWVPNTRLLAAVRRKFGAGIQNDALTAAREQAKKQGALPPSPQYPSDPEAVTPALPTLPPGQHTITSAEAAQRGLLGGFKPGNATDPSAPLSPETRAAIDLAREALRKEPGLAEFSLTFREGKWDVQWRRSVVVTQAGNLTLED